jgi:hypothetical protein
MDSRFLGNNNLERKQEVFIIQPMFYYKTL